MKALTLPIVRIQFSEKIGKTIVECKTPQGNTLTVFANGDQSSTKSLLCNVVVNEIGDTFVATNDSKTMGPDGKTPLFKKGQEVKRQTQSYDFKSFTGAGAASEFAQAANAFGLQLQVVMQS